MPVVAIHPIGTTREAVMVLIGVDPHKGSHTAVAIDGDETQLGRVQVRADRRQLQRLLDWAAPFGQRTWAVEAAAGNGYLLAQQLVGAGESVVDVPAKLASRVRLLGSGNAAKNDPNDALSTAIAALRQPTLAPVRAEDHALVLRLLAKRNHDLGRLRTQAVCRLHTMLAQLVEGGLDRRLTVANAGQMLGRVRPVTAVQTERKRIAHELLADIRRLERETANVKARIKPAMLASGTTVTEIYGVAFVCGAFILGWTGDIRRFPSAAHYASYNGTAPREASSGSRTRHRVNRGGNRMLNHAIHIAAVTQMRNDTPGRAYYLRKVAEGKSEKDALRALKRRVSDAVYRQLMADAAR
jgi:transposase